VLSASGSWLVSGPRGGSRREATPSTRWPRSSGCPRAPKSFFSQSPPGLNYGGDGGVDCDGKGRFAGSSVRRCAGWYGGSRVGSEFRKLGRRFERRFAPNLRTNLRTPEPPHLRTREPSDMLEVSGSRRPPGKPGPIDMTRQTEEVPEPAARRSMWNLLSAVLLTATVSCGGGGDGAAVGPGGRAGGPPMAHARRDRRAEGGPGGRFE
jgi:hypothetical protein